MFEAYFNQQQPEPEQALTEEDLLDIQELERIWNLPSEQEQA